MFIYAAYPTEVGLAQGPIQPEGCHSKGRSSLRTFGPTRPQRDKKQVYLGLHSLARGFGFQCGRRRCHPIGSGSPDGKKLEQSSFSGSFSKTNFFVVLALGTKEGKKSKPQHVL